MSITAADRQRLLEAIVSLATRDGLGEEVFWEQVEPALMELIENPVAERDLRRLVAKINDPAVLVTLADWFERAARERSRDERAALTNNEELLTPVKRFGYGFGAAGLIAAGLGTAALPIALPLIGVGLVLTAAGARAGLTLRRKADQASFDASLLERLARICFEAKDG